jgi:hypothetical protein
VFTRHVVGTLENNPRFTADLLTWLGGGGKVSFGIMNRAQEQARTIMAAVLVLSAAALVGCSGLSGSGTGSADKPKVAFESRPPGAQVSLAPSGVGCTTPCSVPAPDTGGNYNATFTLPGYVSQTLPVKIIVTKQNWYSSDLVEVSPNPLFAVLEPEKPASSRRK